MSEKSAPIPAPPECELVSSFQPSVFYFRKAIREAESAAEKQAAGLLACLELEALESWVRSMGLIPPRFFATTEEAREKGFAIECDQQATQLQAPEPLLL